MKILFCHIEKCGGGAPHNYLRNKIDFYFVLRPTPRHGSILTARQLNIISKILSFQRFCGHELDSLSHMSNLENVYM